MALKQVVEHSSLNARLALKGQLLVALAYGQHTQTYVAKLARLYRQSPDGQTYAQRLNRLLPHQKPSTGLTSPCLTAVLALMKHLPWL